MNMLPVVAISGKRYFADLRLSELRSLYTMDRMDIDEAPALLWVGDVVKTRDGRERRVEVLWADDVYPDVAAVAWEDVPFGVKVGFEDGTWVWGREIVVEFDA